MKMTIKCGNKNNKKKCYVHITYINTIFKILPPLFWKTSTFSPFRVPSPHVKTTPLIPPLHINTTFKTPQIHLQVYKWNSVQLWRDSKFCFAFSKPKLAFVHYWSDQPHAKSKLEETEWNSSLVGKMRSGARVVQAPLPLLLAVIVNIRVA